MRLDTRVAASLVLAGALAACSGPREAPSPTPSAPPVIERTTPSPSPMGTTAELSPTKGNKASGTVTFEPTAGGLRVTAHVEGLPPGDHGFHLHEKGDCSAPDASSAGDHWNPTHQQHGGPDSPQHHAGDLGNVTADASGMAHLDRVVQGLTLEGMDSILGKAVVVHGKADDLKTQPSGASGPRVACGVVGGGGTMGASPMASPMGGMMASPMATPMGTASPGATRSPRARPSPSE